MPSALPGDPDSTDILSIANAPILWIFAVGIFAAIILQTVIYMRAARIAAPAAGITQAELRTSFRAGAVAAIGPSLAVVLVSVALLSLFGGPAVLVRVGLVGSAATETASASIAASTMGAALGDASYTQAVFAVAFMAMSLSGAMWMIATLVLTPLLKRGDSRLRTVNPALMAIIPAAALLGAFASLGIAELGKTPIHVLTVLTSAVVMGVCLLAAHRFQQGWLREWGLGFSIVIGLIVAYAAHSSGLAPIA
ncbi:membrane protein [Cryobacterium roopkundense]|uniref:Membrane protein n=1 Tax=Cryobacterium roopkundense TaxID=1001240 RepID=A0A099JIL1_9MICO|nr:DUF5058 family protein [Cryobacterium roopkundense]KGJ77462.1 membrane protein [Cryobacterium roopkundense]MBB5643328.1 hypothetical protein [Cryobacterium roopkundense]